MVFTVAFGYFFGGFGAGASKKLSPLICCPFGRWSAISFTPSIKRSAAH
jgi:hypothetical protein